MLHFTSTLSTAGMPSSLSASPEKEKYGQSPQELLQFEIKCRANKLNRVVIQNTITAHTSLCYYFSVSNTNNTMHIIILPSVKGE